MALKGKQAVRPDVFNFRQQPVTSSSITVPMLK
jgi:hypothetical protein